MALDITTIAVMPSIVMGVIISVLNLIMMIKDETGSASSVIGHGAGAFIPVFIFTFLSMNLGFLQANVAIFQSGFLANTMIIRIILGFVAAVYVHAHSGIFKGAKGAGTHETWIHSFGLGILVAIAPYLWDFLGPLLPVWMQ